AQHASPDGQAVEQPSLLVEVALLHGQVLFVEELAVEVMVPLRRGHRERAVKLVAAAALKVHQGVLIDSVGEVRPGGATLRVRTSARSSAGPEGQAGAGTLAEPVRAPGLVGEDGAHV